MADYAVTMRVYNGSVLEANLLSSQQTLVLSSLGSSQAGTVSDSDSQIYVGQTTVMGGTPFVMLGSGTVQPGASVLGKIVPLGSPRDVMMLRNTVTGKITFVFPDGTPSVIGAVVMVVDIDPVGYDLVDKSPLCFVRGTRILTPTGYRPVEDLSAGDLVTDREGRDVLVLQVLAQRFTLNQGSRDGVVPVVIEADAFGPGAPGARMALSPQHRVVVGGTGPELWFGVEEALVPVQALVDGVRLRRATGWAQVEYIHVLCAEHAVLVAEGVQAESLLLGPQALHGLGAGVSAGTECLSASVLDRYAAISREPCLPVLSCREGTLLRRTSQESAWPVTGAVRADWQGKRIEQHR